MNISNLPTINAILNTISTVLLIAGYILIKKNNQSAHKRVMIGAMISSALFLISYITYHYSVGSVPYPYHDWTRTIYFSILIPHIILAVVMAPLIIMAVIFALKERFDRHKRLTKWVWPMWIFVSISGIIIYFMLYHL